ncbi:MAG: alpha-D-ribose 1-methylphosphonate 5-triphosphate diphosphatase [Lautropia sp.]
MDTRTLGRPQALERSDRTMRSGELVIANARIVLADDVVRGSLRAIDGRIVDVCEGASVPAGALDLGGDHLVAGLIELHTDNLERHLVPRPRTRFPSAPAILAHDAEIIGAGITTVYDALGVGDPYDDGFRAESQSRVLDDIDALAHAGLLRADHFLHVRCELPAENARELFEAFVGRPRLRLISLMDHTPGQRQWTDISHARIYYTGKKGWSEARFEREVELAPQRQAQYAVPNRRHFVDVAREWGIPLATHDDTTEAHVDEAFALGASISEFPTSLVAAVRAKALGLATIAGAPNVVRGGSHSGNVSAAALAAAGLLDVLSSDYVPASLINAAWRLQEAAGFDLPRAMATVTVDAAAAAKLTDRGRIAPGLRADLARVRIHDGQPAIGEVWREGRRVH